MTSPVQTGSKLDVFKHFADASGYGCAWTALDGRVAYANPALAALLGVASEASLIGHPLVAALDVKTRTLISDVVLPQVCGGEPWTGEFMFSRADGTASHSQANLFLIRDETESPAFIGVMLADLSARVHSETERARSEAQVQHAQKLESLVVLAGGIAHDFNHLLCGIMGSAELAMQSLDASHPAQEDLELVLQTAQRATELCQQMLAYSGRGQFVIEPVDLSRFVQDMMPLLKASLHQKASLELQVSPGLPLVMGDTAQLRQVLLNLVMNASEALGTRPGRIGVSTGTVSCSESYLVEHCGALEIPPGTYAFVEVSDSGIGMDESVRARAFDPFFSTKFTGRGLGLAAALGIVRGHRGAIGVASTVGRGTSLRVLLPCATAAAALSGTSPGTPQPKAVRGRILLVDDESSVRTVGERMLTKLGFEVETAGDGPSGIRLYRERAGGFDLVLLDMTMPGLDGSDVCRELQRVRADVKVVLMSGYTENEATQHFTERSLVAFLAKPFRLDALSKCVESALGRPKP